ncbi:MAG: NAD-dependent epimerase/dehydratase family protein [Candidatus Aenigmarchaeota archaeon]|nr:NAD-dependent epimerase/dehydratase family protein [Candidatus Aenigmarchaeota archaeon]MDI6722996.1 NAD-dependent epimerase/dehydratase family protein [Candidatus Aenigmarchaeota archaeon]
MKVLVTGGAGFIGSNLVDYLIKEGHEANILDSIASGKKNINKKAKFFEGDIRDEDDVRAAMHGCQAVFHLAAIADAREDGDDINYNVNYLGAKNVFDMARENGAKIIFTSSAAVYGDKQTACKEDGKCEPIGEYGKNKLRSEKAAGRDAFILRMFNVYGPRGNSVVNRFCERIPEYNEIHVFGNGLQTRDFVHVNDVIEALVLGLDRVGVYNAGTGIETTVLNLIDMIFNLTRNKPNVRYDMAKNEIKRSKADISKIKKLGWEPKITLKDGIKDLLKRQGVKLANEL